MKISIKSPITTDLDCLDPGMLFAFTLGGGLCLVTDRDAGGNVAYVELISGQARTSDADSPVVVYEGTLTASPKIS